MERKTAGIIATVAAVLLCGFPGFISLCAGLLAAAISQVPNADINVMGNNDPGAALGFGLTALFIGIIFLLIPLLVGYFSLRNRDATPSAATVDATPAPPTSERLRPMPLDSAQRSVGDWTAPPASESEPEPPEEIRRVEEDDDVLPPPI